MILCRACGVPPNKYRQAYRMDICRTCEIDEIRADIMNDAEWWTTYRDLQELKLHQILLQASQGVREGLQYPIPYGET